MLQKIRYFAFLIGVLVLVIVAFQNQEPVDIQLLFFSGSYPLMLLLLGCSGLSFVLGAFLAAWRIRRRAKAKAAKAAASQAEAAQPPVEPEPPAEPEPDDHPVR